MNIETICHVRSSIAPFNPKNGDGMFLQNTGNFLSEYMASVLIFTAMRSPNLTWEKMSLAMMYVIYWCFMQQKVMLYWMHWGRSGCGLLKIFWLLAVSKLHPEQPDSQCFLWDLLSNRNEWSNTWCKIIM